MTNKDLDLAREWAKEVSEEYFDYITVDSRAAIKVIQSLPDQWIDAEKVRELADQLVEEAEDFASEGLAHRYMVIAKRLRDTLTPSLLTLADMDEDDRHALVGKDVKVEGWESPSMLIAVYKDEGAVLGHTWINPWPFVEVRPLSELTPVDTAPDRQVNSSETPKGSLPRPEDVPPGEPWLVMNEGCRDQWVGTRDDSGTTNWPWILVKIDGTDYALSQDVEVTLISRLVPEVKP